MRRALSALCAAVTAVAAAVAGVATPAAAYVPSPTRCETEPLNVTVLDTPVLVQVAAYTPEAPYYERAVVCIGTKGGATDGIAYQDYEVGVRPAGTRLPGACNGGGFGDQYTGVGTALGTTSGSFGANGGAGFSVAPQVCAYGDGTYQVLVPFLLCAGGGCPLYTEPAVQRTGVVAGTFAVTPGPGGLTGAGVTLVDTTLWIDGIAVPVGPATYTAAGVNAGLVGYGLGGAVVCGPLGLVCVPGAAGVHYAGGTVLGVALPGAGTVYVPSPVPGTCVPLFNVPPSGQVC